MVRQVHKHSSASLQVVTVVNRDAVERVAPPPTLRVVEYAPGPWAPPAAPGDGVLHEPVAEFVAKLARARKRLQCASDYFE